SFCFSSRRRHTRFSRDWSSDVCSSDLLTLTKGVLYQLSYMSLQPVHYRTGAGSGNRTRTISLEGWGSTMYLSPPRAFRPVTLNLVEGEGFEPSKAKPSDLQSDPFDRSGTPPQKRRHF